MLPINLQGILRLENVIHLIKLVMIKSKTPRRLNETRIIKEEEAII